ncbi:MAG: CBS domain-containing protein [Myxococcota bacterium]
MPQTIADIMQKKVRTIAPERTLPELERELLRSRVGALPVVDRDGKLIGIVSRSDVVRQLCLERSLGEAMADAYRDQTDAGFVEKSQQAIAVGIGQRMERLCVRDVMIHDLITVAPDLPVEDAAKLLWERRIHRLPVLENGRLVGIVSTLDFTRIVAEAR